MGHEFNKVVAGLISEKDLSKIREAVCVQVEKIYDSCKEKDCIEDARVFFKNDRKIQWLIKNAVNVKAKRAEVLDVFVDVEPIPFKRGFFTVDVKFVIKVALEFFVHGNGLGVKVIPVTGLLFFDKKVVLFGSEGNVKIFTTQFKENKRDKNLDAVLEQTNLPIAKIEVAEPIALNARIADKHEKKCRGDFDDNIDYIPKSILECLDDYDIGNVDIDWEIDDDDSRHDDDDDEVVLASVGLFSIIKLARLVQLLIPAFDFCTPNKSCIASTDENPCEIFDTIEFPIDEFFPPQKSDFPGAFEQERNLIEKKEST